MQGSIIRSRVAVLFGLCVTMGTLTSSVRAATFDIVNPRSISFSSQVVGMSTASKPVSLRNTGASILTFSSIALTGEQADDFALLNGCKSSLSVGEACTLLVGFRPVSAGAKKASLSIVDNVPGSPQVVTLGGIGLESDTPIVELSPTDLVFGSQATGSASAAKAIKVTNSSSGVLLLNSITLSGRQRDDFALVSDCSSKLLAGKSCLISITFTPVSVGKKLAILSVTDHLNSSPQTVIVTGTGEAKTPPPIFSPVTGTYSSPQTVSIDATVASARVYYTTDGSMPTSASTRYAAPFNIAMSQTIQAIAVMPGDADSEVVSAAYTLGSPSSNSSTWLPFLATPTPGSSNGRTGIFVLPSNQLLTASPRFVSRRSGISMLYSATQATNLYTASARYMLGAEIYSAVGSDGRTHLYGIALNDTDATPVEHQITNLSFADAANICTGLGSGQTDYADAKTFWFLLDIAGTGGCGGSSDKVVVVHYIDSATVTPNTVELSALTSRPFFSELVGLDHKSQGILILDASGVLSFYADDTFLNPKKVLSDVSGFEAAASDASHHYFDVSLRGTSTNPTQTNVIFSIEPPGTAKKVFALQAYGTHYVQDSANFYFVDGHVVYKKALSAGAPLALFNTDSKGAAEIVGSSGSALVLQETSQEKGFDVIAIPTDVSSRKASTLFSHSKYDESFVNFEAFMPLPEFVGESNNSLVSINQVVTSADSAAAIFSSAIVTAAGAVQQSLLTDSLLCPDERSPNLFKLQNIVQTNGSGGGATIVAINRKNFSAIELTLAGAAYHVPDNYALFDVDYYDSSQSQALLAMYTFSTTDSAIHYKVAGVDLVSGEIRPISIANTQIAPIN